MRFIKPDVRTICCGIAMSMGSLILAGGAPGKRQALPNSRILIHQPHGGFQGQTTDIEIHAREAHFLRRRMEEIYAEHTGRTPEEVRADMERDRFFTPEEAVEYGLIDRVFADRNGNGTAPAARRLSGAGRPVRRYLPVASTFALPSTSPAVKAVVANAPLSASAAPCVSFAVTPSSVIVRPRPPASRRSGRGR